MVDKIINIVVSIVDKVIPVGNKYRTSVLVLSLGVIATLDAFGITHGIYQVVSPYIWPLAVGTALAHLPTDKIDALFHGQIVLDQDKK